MYCYTCKTGQYAIRVCIPLNVKSTRSPGQRYRSIPCNLLTRRWHRAHSAFGQVWGAFSKCYGSIRGSSGCRNPGSRQRRHDSGHPNGSEVFMAASANKSLEAICNVINNLNAVFFFPKLKIYILGYFDPTNILFDNKNKYFFG